MLDECHADVRGSVKAECGPRTLLRSAAVTAVWSLRRRCPYHDGSVGSPSLAARAMTVARNAADATAHHFTLEIEALDRLYLDVYQPQLQTTGGIAVFFCSRRRRQVASSALMAPMTRTYVTAVERCARDEVVDLVTFLEGERKDDRTQEYLRQWPGGEGLLYIGKSREKSRVPRTRGATDSVTGFRRASLHFSTALENSYYCYFVDEDCGPAFSSSAPDSPSPRGCASTATSTPSASCSGASSAPRTSTPCCESGWRGCRIRSRPPTGRPATATACRSCRP